VALLRSAWFAQRSYRALPRSLWQVFQDTVDLSLMIEHEDEDEDEDEDEISPAH